MEIVKELSDEEVPCFLFRLFTIKMETLGGNGR